MNKNILVKFFFLFIFYTIGLNAQDNLIIKNTNSTSISDSVNPSSYFPMAVNNFWQYSFLDDVVLEEFVYKDSTINDGSNAYFLLMNGVGNQYPNYIIKNYNVCSGHPVSEYRMFFWKLDVNLGEEWWVRHLTDDTTQGVYRKVEAIFDGTYLGVNTSFKEISEYTRELLIDSTYLDIFRFRYWLAAGFGLVMTTTDQMTEPPTYLSAAIINGDTIGTIVSVKDIQNENLLPEIELSQNYPNPFNPSTTIRYQIPKDGMITIKVYDILGREIKTLVNEYKTKGRYEVNFDASNLASGLYIYEIQSGSYKASKKMTLIK